MALEQPGSPLVSDGGGPVESAAGDEVQVWASPLALALRWELAPALDLVLESGWASVLGWVWVLESV